MAERDGVHPGGQRASLVGADTGGAGRGTPTERPLPAALGLPQVLLQEGEVPQIHTAAGKNFGHLYCKSIIFQQRHIFSIYSIAVFPLLYWVLWGYVNYFFIQ